MAARIRRRKHLIHRRIFLFWASNSSKKRGRKRNLFPPHQTEYAIRNGYADLSLKPYRPSHFPGETWVTCINPQQPQHVIVDTQKRCVALFSPCQTDVSRCIKTDTKSALARRGKKRACLVPAEGAAPRPAVGGTLRSRFLSSRVSDTRQARYTSLPTSPNIAAPHSGTSGQHTQSRVLINGGACAPQTKKGSRPKPRRRGLSEWYPRVLEYLVSYPTAAAARRQGLMARSTRPGH